MKDSKSILLLVVSVLLILVSCALLWTWGYNFNNFAKDKQGTVFIVKDSTTATNATRDSLKKIYASTIENIGTLDSTWMHADSLKTDLDIKLSEFYKLRNEIAIILKNPAKKEDLDLAKQKIGELQKKVDQLRSKNTDVENENKRLYAVLQQLTNAQRQVLQQQPSAKSVVFENKEPTSNPTTSFSASDMRLLAMTVEGDKEQETYQALQADKFVGSFNVKNSAAFNSTEIVIVLLQPDNKVLQTSAWETGRFDTREGKKIYSCKVKFEYARGENKRLSFSLNSDKFQKGIYTMQLYYNGNLIGKMAKTLI
ncbi:MAG: hypothetical protein H7258_10925 [Ferruginibacter sp.]|nr:hypothetical protein [Ferruginibacter sp.]